MLTSKGWFLCCVLATEAVYAIAAAKLPWWRYGTRLNSWGSILGWGAAQGPNPADGTGAWGFWGCLGGFVLLFTTYALGWRLVQLASVSRRLIWVGAVLFAMTLFCILPITADLFVYLGQAHMLTDLGANPLAAVREPFDDPLLAAYPIAYSQRPSVYGPAWLILSAPATLARWGLVGGIAYLKGLAAVAFLGCAWVLERILRMIRPQAALQGLYLFAWNPLLLLMGVGDGHNDIVMMVLALLALWWLAQGRPSLSMAALALAVWTKYVAVVFAPLWILYVWQRNRAGKQPLEQMPSAGGYFGRGEVVCSLQTRPDRNRRQDWLCGLAAGAAVSCLVCLPFWPPDWLGGVILRLLRPINFSAAGNRTSEMLLIGGLVLFTAAGGLLVRRHVARAVREPANDEVALPSLFDMSFLLALLALLASGARTQPWHAIWPGVLAGLSSRRWAWPAFVALSAVLLAAQLWVEWGAPGWPHSF